MTPYNKALHALGVPGGLTLEDDGQYEILYLTSAYSASLGDAGHEFESQLSGISHREVIPATAWANRVFDAAGFSVSDPGNSQTVTQFVLVKSGNGSGGSGGGGTAGTNRLLAHHTLGAPVTWDGAPDQHGFAPQGIFRIGGV